MKPITPLHLFFGRSLATVLGVMVFCLASQQLSAAFTWDGGGGNANWSTNNNWAPNGAPTAGTITDYIFAGTTKTTNSANGGTLWEVNSITFDNTAGAFVISGTGLKLQSTGIINNDTQTQTINNTIALQATATINAASGSITLGGIISGTGFGLTKTGGNTLTLNAANTYTGTTTVSAGTLAYGIANALASGNVTVSGGTLAVGNFSDTIGAVSLTSGSITGGTGVLTGTSYDMQSGTVSAILGGSGVALTKTTSGTVTLSGVNTYTGVTSVNAGTLSVGTIGNGGVAGNLGQASNAAANLVLGGGTLQYTGATASTDRNFTLTTGTTSTIDVSTLATNLTISGASTATTGGLTKVGAGTLTLSGANLYTGTTTVSAGTLAYGITNALASGNVTVSGGTLAVGNFSDTVGAVSLTSGSITGGSGVLTGTSYGMQSGTVSAILGGSGVALTKTTSGTVTLSGVNTYTGVTSVNAGTLSVGTIGNGGVAGNLGQASNAAANLVLGGGTLQYTGATASTDRNFTLTTGTTSTIDVSTLATNLTISGASTATTGGLTKVGAGTLTLSGANLYTGATTVSAGTLMGSGANSLGDTSGNITVSAGATLALAGGTNIVRSGLLTLNGSGVSSSFGALAAEGSTGTTSQWTGSTTINSASTVSAADNLLIIGNGATGQFNTTTMTLNANVTFNTTAAATVVPTYLPAPAYILDASNIVVNSQITGTGGIIKTGTGTLSLIRGTSTDNTFSGDTSVLGGKLIVDGPSNHTPLSSTNIYVGNLGSASNDTVTLQMGELATASGNNIIGTYNASTDASTSNLFIYEDGVFKMNQGNNGFVNLTLSGGHVDSGGNNALLTLSGALTTLASAQTSLIENGNLGIGSNKLTVTSAAGTTSSGIDLQIDSKIQQGALFTAVATGTALEKTGAGKVVLTGANTYGGITDVLAGVLNIQNNTALGQNNTGYTFNSTNNGTTVSSGAELQVQGGITVTQETLTLAGTGTSSTGALHNVSGNNNLNSYIYLSADARINSDSGTLTIANPSGVNSGVLDGTAAGKNLTVGGAGNTTINGAIGGNVAGITKDGTGTLTLAGNDAYTGATAVTAGILKVTHSNGLAGTGVTVSNNAALQFAQDASSANIAEVGIAANITGTGISNGGAIENLNGNNSYAGNVTLAGNSRITSDASSSLTLSGSVTGAGFALSAGGAGDTTYNGVISGAGTALTKTDAGTVTLGGTSANTYTGATTINGGTLALNKTAGVNAIASSTVTIGNGSGAAGSTTLLLSQSNQIIDSAAVSLGSDGKLNLNSKNETVGSIAGSGQILFGTGQLIEGGSNASTTFSGTLAGSAGSSLTKNGSGTLTISSNVNAVAGDFAGDLNLTAGGLTFSASNTFAASTLNVAAGTTLTLSNSTLSVANLNFTGTGAVTLDFGGASTLQVLNNLTLSAGVTINIINWTNAVDYWYAANWSGAVLDIRGQSPMNQIIFNSPTWVGNNTIWQSYDHQITPVPEPSTYGALLLGAMGAFLGYRRHRQSKASAKK